MNRTTLINHIARKIRAKSYLEIGVWNGANFQQISCRNKIGVDPDPESPATLKITSDEFFEQNKETFDIIFIDGLHHADQVEKDVINSLKVLNEGGFIICHDMNPQKKEHQVVPFNGGVWNGDCWRAFVKLRQERSDLVMFTIDTDYGCSVIKKGQQELLKIDEDVTYENFDKNRKKWLNLISVTEFYDMAGEIALEDLLYQYINDPNDPENNYQMAIYYDGIGQTASAVSYYLRAAERSPTDILKYECLVRASLCFNKQGMRNFTVKGLLQHAISLLPKRPEAYYLMSRHYENNQVDGHWTNSYMMASIGEKASDFNSPPLRTWVDYPGYYAMTFQRALAAWHCGLCDESRDTFKLLLRDRNVDDNFKHVIINNLKFMNVYHEIPFDTYTPEKYEKFKFKFPGLEEVKENFSEAYQDMFVLSILKGKKNGTYLEIGAGSPFFGSNTVLLEQFGWKGHGFDVNPLAVDSNRKNPCVLKDALTVDYDELLSDMEYGEIVDFLQVDLEPAETTYEALKVIPWDKYKFRVITFEHDYYNDESKSFRDKSREYLQSKGYELLVTNIAPDTLRVFEDWWVHPDLVDRDMIERFKNTDDQVKKAERILIED
jgi:tetratricopeptide (TPR) repeat protein